MLQKLNERIQGVVAWVVIILIAITFTLFGIDYYMQSHQASNNQVEVNGEGISKETFELTYRRARQFREAGQMTAEGENQLKKQVLDEMIVNTVSVQAAKLNGFSVSLEQANAAILSIPQFQEDGHFSAGRYQQALSGAFFTPESFRKEVKQGMLLNQQRFAFIGTAFALPNEINRFVKLYMQTRNYQYLIVPALPFINQASVSDNEIETYYKNNQKEFYAPEKVSIDFIRLSMQDIKSRVVPTEEQIRRYYDDNQSNYTTPAKWQVAHILFAIPSEASSDEQKQVQDKAEQVYQILQEHPDQFSEQVKASDDKISVRNQGLLPWISAGQSTLDKYLANLTTPGQMTAPVKTEHGFEIFKLVAYKASSVKPYEKVQAEIKDQVSVELAQNTYTQALEQLSDLSYQTPDSLAPVAEALNLKVEQSQPFTREGGDIPLTKNKQIVNAAFSHDVLELGNNSEPIQVDNDSVVVLRVNQHVPSKLKDLAEVKTIIQEQLRLRKAQVLAEELGNQVLKENQNMHERQKLISENQLKWEQKIQVAREGDKSMEEINEIAFNLPRPGAQTGTKLANGDFVLVQLNKINDGTPDALDKEQLASITQQIEASYGVMDYDLFVKSQLAQAKVEKSK